MSPIAIYAVVRINSKKNEKSDSLSLKPMVVWINDLNL